MRKMSINIPQNDGSNTRLSFLRYHYKDQILSHVIMEIMEDNEINCQRQRLRRYILFISFRVSCLLNPNHHFPKNVSFYFIIFQKMFLSILLFSKKYFFLFYYLPKNVSILLFFCHWWNIERTILLFLFYLMHRSGSGISPKDNF